VENRDVIPVVVLYRRLSSFGLLLTMSVAMVGNGCSSKLTTEDYRDLVKSGVHTVPRVDEIKAIFRNDPVDCFVGQNGLDLTKPAVWYTEVYFGGKYVFAYEVNVKVDYKNNRIVGIVSEPTFYLCGVSKVLHTSSGNVGADFEPGWILGEKEWNKTVADKGDFSAIGIHLNTNSPIQGFKEYVDAKRKGRVPVDP
jgi:hypothetical protein